MKYKFYNRKAFIYTIQGIGWIALPLAIHIGLFHGKLLDKYPLLSLVLVLIYPLSGYKIDYKKMKFSKKLLTAFGDFIIWILCGFIVYFIGCTK